MSETFLIKHTGFDTSGSIIDKENNSFIIGTGELNGPNGFERSSDLRLYGLGALKWGEGVNEDLLRLLENHNCPAKTLNDYNPATQLNDYDPLIDNILPRDEFDLGIGNGITVPVIGQSWYNSDNNLTYTYDGTLWTTIINFDGSLTLDGVLDMSGFGIINLLDPINPQDAMTLFYADTRYVNVSGDTMSGVLNMGGNVISGVSNPINPQDAMTLFYADTNYVNVSGDTISGQLNINGGLDVIGNSTFSTTPTVTGNDVYHQGNDGAGSGLDADTVDGLHAAEIVLNLVYPIGSVYISVNNTNPSALFGGTWAQYAQGQTIIGHDPGDPFYTAGNSGGDKDAVNITHTHTALTAASGLHNHALGANVVVAQSPFLPGVDPISGTSPSGKFQTELTTGSHTHVMTVANSGVSGVNLNLPPYIVTYMWQRTG